MKKFVNATITIAARDFTKYVKDKTRLVFSLIFPFIFIGILGTQNQIAFGTQTGFSILLFTFIGTIANTMFQSTTQGIVSLLEDRDNDFAQEMFVSPIPRSSIAAGKILGETMVSAGGVLAQLVLIPLLNVPVDYSRLLLLIPFLFLAAFVGGAFGLALISFLKNQKSANQIFPLLIFPQFFLAGVFTPIKVLSDNPTIQERALNFMTHIVPLTYVVDMIRNIYYGEGHAAVRFPLWLDLSVVIGMIVILGGIGIYMFSRAERNK